MAYTRIFTEKKKTTGYKRIFDTQEPVKTEPIKAETKKLDPFSLSGAKKSMGIQPMSIALESDFPREEKLISRETAGSTTSSFRQKQPTFIKDPLNIVRDISLMTKDKNSFVSKALKNILPSSLSKKLELKEKEVSDYMMSNQKALETYQRAKIMDSNLKEFGYTGNETVDLDYKEPKSAVGQYVEEVKNFLPQAQKAVGGVLEGLNFSPELNKKAQRIGDKAMANILSKPERFAPEDMTARQWAGRSLGQLTNSLGATLTASVGAGLVGGPIAGIGTGILSGYTLEAGNFYRDLIESGVNPSDAGMASAAYGSIATVLENAMGISPTKLAKNVSTRSLKLLIKEEIKNAPKLLLRRAFEEGSEEAAQQITENIVSNIIGKNIELFANVPQSFAAGALGGFAFGGAGVVAGGVQKVSQDYKQMTPQERQAGFTKNPLAGEPKDIKDRLKELESVTADKNPTVSERLKEIETTQDKGVSISDRLKEIGEEVETPTAKTEAETKPDPLTTEADKAIAKYPNDLEKATEEFIGGQLEKEYRSAHQVDTKISSPITKISEDTLNTFIDEFKRQYGYPSLKSKEVNKLKSIISNPDADVTIYRASPKNELNSGDWVTIDKDYANDIKRQNGGKVYRYTVKADDLFYPKTLEGFDELPSLNKWGAFQYQSSELKSQLTDLIKERFEAKQKEVKPTKEVEKEETKADKDKIISTHYERIKDEFGFDQAPIELDKMTAKEQKKKTAKPKLKITELKTSEVRDIKTDITKINKNIDAIVKKGNLTRKEFSDLEAEVNMSKEVLASNPASQLREYEARGGEFKGQLPEVDGIRVAKPGEETKSQIFARSGDQIITEFGFADTETAREEYFKYKNNVEMLKATEVKLKNLRKDLTDIRKKESVLKMIESIKKEGGKMTRDKIVEVQGELRKIVKESKLDAKDREKFTDRIRKVADSGDPVVNFSKLIPEIEQRISELKNEALKRSIRIKINKELGVKTIKKQGGIRKAKYDYSTNKLIRSLQEKNKLNQKSAISEFNEMPKDGLSNSELIQKRFLSYKANGSKSSLIMTEQVLADIQMLKEVGRDIKDEQELIDKINKQNKRDEVFNAIEKNRKGKLASKIRGGLVDLIGNLYSDILTIAGKDIADKYDNSYLMLDKQDNIDEVTETVIGDLMTINNLKDKKELSSLFRSMLNDKIEIRYKDGVNAEISKLEILDIYNTIKNDLGKERYYNWLGAEQVNDLMSMLTQEEMEMADYMMDIVQSYRDKINKRNVELYGIDLGYRENYWMFSSDRNVDFIDQHTEQSQTPSFMKEASKSSEVKPLPRNAYYKLLKYISEAEHLDTVSKSYEELKNIFSSSKVKGKIKEIYGEDVYNTFQDQIDTMSLHQETKTLNAFEKSFSYILNNWVKAKIASPTVFARQLNSMIYSLDQMPAKEWLNYFTEGISNPKKTFDFMWNNIPSIKKRYNRGYSDAVEEAIKGANAMKVHTNSITNLTSILSRSGDITAIIYSGYPIIKSELAKHGDMNKAITAFKKSTGKTQQSGASPDISAIQRNQNPLVKLFTRFKNSLNQFARLQANAIIAYNNGEISRTQLAKTTFLYSVYTPASYVFMGILINQAFGVIGKAFGVEGDDDEDENILLDLFSNMILQPFKVIPIFGDIVEFAVRKITKQKTYGMVNYPLLDDLERAGSKAFKKEPSLKDVIDVISILQEPMTGLPTETILRYGRKVVPEKSGEEIQQREIKPREVKQREVKPREIKPRTIK